MKHLHSPEGEARARQLFAEMDRQRDAARIADGAPPEIPEPPRTVTTESGEVLTQSQMRRRHENSFPWWARWLRRRLGITSDLALIADATNGRFSDIWKGENTREQAITDLTSEMNRLATQVNSLVFHER